MKQYKKIFKEVDSIYGKDIDLELLKKYKTLDKQEKQYFINDFINNKQNHIKELENYFKNDPYSFLVLNYDAKKEAEVRYSQVIDYLKKNL